MIHSALKSITTSTNRLEKSFMELHVHINNSQEHNLQVIKDKEGRRGFDRLTQIYPFYPPQPTYPERVEVVCSKDGHNHLAIECSKDPSM